MLKKIIDTKISLGVLIFLLAFIVFYTNLQNISKHCFDEFHYIPAAKEWIKLAPDNNLEHPPLGKIIIASSIKIFGDNPLGWRATSVLAGSITILICFLTATLIFDDLIISISVALFSLFNFWIYVQSRIGMLDIFMILFLLVAIYYFFKYEALKKQKHLYLMSMFWGLSVAIKWSAVYTYLPFFLMFLLSDLNSKKIINSLKMGIISLGVYFFTYLPYVFSKGRIQFSFVEIFTKIPFEMLHLQKLVPGNHPYSSTFYSWPFMTRPIWYEYINYIKKGYFQGIILLGNPIQMVVGFFCVCSLILKNNRAKKLTQAALVLFLCSWLMWAVVPRKLTLFYYFFPAAMFYSFLIPMTLNEFFSPKKTRVMLIIITLLSIAFFIYFYPILSGSLESESNLSKWMWMNSWI